MVFLMRLFRERIMAVVTVVVVFVVRSCQWILTTGSQDCPGLPGDLQAGLYGKLHVLPRFQSFKIYSHFDFIYKLEYLDKNLVRHVQDVQAS